MFIGHYALAFSGKKLETTVSLGTLFLAVQWLDLIWPVFVLAGLEHFSVEPGNTVLTPLRFDHYPWSHSLLMAVAWGFVIGMIYYLLKKNRKISLLLFFLVVSHWALDFITHAPDLPLSPFSDEKYGLGLWNYKWPEILIETFIYLFGFYWYVSVTRPKNRTGKWSLLALFVFLLAIHFINLFGPPPPGINAVAWAALAQWLIVAWAYWIDRNRS